MSKEISAQTIKLLQKSNKCLCQSELRELLAQPDRFEDFSLGFDGLLYDFSRVRIDHEALDGLLGAVREVELERQREALFAGGIVNRSEDRPAMHMLLRDPSLAGAMNTPDSKRAASAMRTMLDIASDLNKGELPGAPDTPIKHIVHVGIGGSLLGPKLVCEALAPAEAKIQVHFLGSVDAHQRERLLPDLDPAETVVVLVSKSFTTGDTLAHARHLRNWLESSIGEVEASRRMFAVTSAPEKAENFGIDGQHVLYFPQWVGGRYSLWSPVGLSIAALAGVDAFSQLLAGASAVDQHFQTAKPRENLPIIMGLVGVWHRNVCGYRSLGVMPYDHRLRTLPAFLQQLVMESNGKSVRNDGGRTTLATAPVVFGETGTDAQHSVFQALHQGTDTIPVQFIGVIIPDHNDAASHTELMANMLAQATALAQGRSEEETRQGLNDAPESVAHRCFDGNRPSELLLLDTLDPYRLGMLLALYEHKVFVESVLYNINAFDQWGVELGKTLAPGIQDALEGQSEVDGLAPLLRYIQERNPGS